jgi:GcrA cell cycle regulator
MEWSEKQVRLLKEEWQAGTRTADIADAVGAPSRNSVIGKANRLGLTRRPSPLTPEGREWYRRQNARVTIFEEWTGIAAAMEKLGEGCKWPEGDPKSSQFKYCGGSRCCDKCAYCAKHTKLAYVPYVRRR